MNLDLKNRLDNVKRQALAHDNTPDDLIRKLTQTCRPRFNISGLYSQLGIITSREAQDLLGNNVIASIRQHDLSAAEFYREQKRRVNGSHAYYTEAIHGCHTAPTVAPVTYWDVLNVIHLIKNQN